MLVRSVWHTANLLVEVARTIIDVLGIGLPLAIAIILLCG